MTASVQVEADFLREFAVVLDDEYETAAARLGLFLSVYVKVY
jgi:hypothetical protein